MDKKSGSSGSWAIQVESLKNKKFVDEIITELKNEGYSPYYVTVMSPGKSKWYKIRTGSFKNKAEAQRALNRLKKKYKDRAIIVFDNTTKPAEKKKASTVDNKKDQQPKIPVPAVSIPEETSSSGVN